MRTLSRDQARRLALGAQGFTRPRPTGRVDVRHFRRVLDTVGLLQLDTVNVLVRAHYLPMFSRLGAYDMGALDRWTVKSGELFEYWGHVASLLPTSHYPRYRWRMEAVAAKPWGAVRRILTEQPDYIDEVMRQVSERGPLTVGDLDHAGERGGTWWDWQPGKEALEWLFAIGRLTAYRNGTFGRVYDLPERVISAEALGARPLDKPDAYRVLLMDAARHLGVGTGSDLADYHRLRGPLVRRVLQELSDRGDLEQVRVDGWTQPSFVHREVVLPRRAAGTALLSPFDSLVFKRDRVERLFDFHYRIEIYVPQPKRRFGYYVLPFLLDGELVARVDLKADRDAGSLLVQAAHIEKGADPGRTAAALTSELVEMAGWLDLRAIEVKPRGDLAGRLARTVG
jgi:uncharacterized protein